MTGPILDQINIVSADFDAILSFYRSLGVELRDPFRTPEGEPFHSGHQPAAGGALEVDSPRFARMWNRGWADDSDLAGRTVIGLRVADRAAVDRLYAEVTSAGHKGLQPPYDAFWGARYAVVEDPDGRAVGLMSPAEDRYRSAPAI